MLKTANNTIARQLGILASQLREARRFLNDNQAAQPPYRNHPDTLAVIKQAYRERVEDTFEHIKFSLGL